MAINIVDVEKEVLGNRPQPLTIVSLHALNLAREPYRTILLQPAGVVEANDARVGHADPALGHAMCSGFLASAIQGQSDLAVAPEYCVPWTVVQEIVDGQHRPPQGAIWVLGCESIAPADFQALAQQYNATGNCVFHHEPLDARQAAQRRYVDPLLYVFWTKNQEGQSVLFILAQIKTVACRDYRDIEQTSLCLGSTVYAFNREVNCISLVAIICSDAFDFTDHIPAIHTNCLLIHIQLNPKPAHTDYAAYRDKLCSVGGNSNVELLCLNWAKNVQEVKGVGKYLDWNNVAGSAWYAPSAKFSADDGFIDSLHRGGLYYCLLKGRWHSFFLNYEGQVIQLQKQKLLFLGEQALLPKNFVAVEERWTWNQESGKWDSGAVANDGFSDVLSGYHAIREHLQLASEISPLSVERAIEILMGPRGQPNSWYKVNELEAIHLDRDEESIRRVTVHQDPDLTRPGTTYRMQRLQRAHDAIGLSQSEVPWPPAVQDLSNGFTLAWKPNTPHHNVEPNTGERGPASLVYLSDQANDLVIDSTYQKLRESVIAHAVKKAIEAGKNIEELSDAVVRAQDRLCVVFRRDNRFDVRVAKGANHIDTPSSTSAVDFSQE